jgi:hypothetical protein
MIFVVAQAVRRLNLGKTQWQLLGIVGVSRSSWELWRSMDSMAAMISVEALSSRDAMGLLGGAAFDGMQS